MKIFRRADRALTRRSAVELELSERLQSWGLRDDRYIVREDLPEFAEEEVEFIPLSPEQEARIKAAVCGAPDQVGAHIVCKFIQNLIMNCRYCR